MGGVCLEADLGGEVGVFLGGQGGCEGGVELLVGGMKASETAWDYTHKLTNIGLGSPGPSKHLKAPKLSERASKMASQALSCYNHNKEIA
jgi:hypothetical protein